MALLRLLDEKPDEEIRQVLRQVIDDAKVEWSPLEYEGEYPIKGFGITEIRPRHVGLSTDYWQFTVTSSWSDWINKTLSDNNYIVVEGIFNLTPDPQTTEIFPSANGKDLPIINIEQLYTLDIARAWFGKPFAVKPNGNLTIQAIGRATNTEHLGLLGHTIAKVSYLINKTP